MLASPGAARMTLEAALSTDRRRSDIAMQPACDRHLHRRVAVDRNPVAWVRRADIHLQLEIQHLATADKTARNLAHAGNLSGRDLHGKARC